MAVGEGDPLDGGGQSAVIAVIAVISLFRGDKAMTAMPRVTAFSPLPHQSRDLGLRRGLGRSPNRGSGPACGLPRFGKERLPCRKDHFSPDGSIKAFSRRPNDILLDPRVAGIMGVYQARYGGGVIAGGEPNARHVVSAWRGAVDANRLHTYGMIGVVHYPYNSIPYPIASYWFLPRVHGHKRPATTPFTPNREAGKKGAQQRCIQSQSVDLKPAD